MRKILATKSDLEFLQASARLLDNGIPVFEQSRYSDIPGHDHEQTGFRILCIWLDFQYEDAMNLLRDPFFVVQNPVDIATFQAIHEEAKRGMDESLNQLLKMAFKPLLLIIIICIVLVILFVMAHIAKSVFGLTF